MGYHEVAQICLNGHVITDRFNQNTEFRKDFCDKCGSSTIHQCPNCNNNIQGDYIVEGYFSIGHEPHLPNYCLHCGHPFPWTESRLDAAKDLVMATEELEEKELLVQSLPDLVADTPRTSLAASRWKKALIKVGGYTAEAFREILIDVLSESAKKILFP